MRVGSEAVMSQTSGVEKRLREMILKLDIGPGERITERWAEGEFSASRTPIRAALMRLEAEGLVCREGRGWMVAPIDLKEIEQWSVYREVLEVSALRLATGHLHEGSLATLDALLDACTPDMSREEADRAGMEFHVALSRLAQNEVITRGIVDAMHRLARARWVDNGPDHHGWTEHRLIVKALREDDVERAMTLLGTHLQESRHRLLKALRENRRTLRSRGIVLA
jgi:DNA-binding GntR family transcriptional regulator